MINITAPVNDTGYGNVGKHLLLAFAELGAGPAFFPIGNVAVHSAADLAVLRQAWERAKCYNPAFPSFRLDYAWDMAHHPTRGLRAGATFFEVEPLRADEVHHLNQLDRVFAFGGWAAGVMQRSGVSAEKITTIACGVDRSIFAERPLPTQGPTRFLGAGKWERRKGQDILLQAFLRAFRPEDDVELVLLCENPFLSAEQNRAWSDSFLKSPLGSRMRILGRQTTAHDVAHVFSQVHCGVFPSRGEGWNLEALELLSMGRHVIATACTAHLDFLTPKNAVLVPVGPLEPALTDKGQVSASGRWYSLGEETIQATAHALQTVHEARLQGRLALNRPGIETACRLNWQTIAQTISQALGLKVSWVA